MDTPLVQLVQDVTDAARVWRDDAIVPLITLQQERGQSQDVIAQYRDGPAVPAFQAIADALRLMRARVDATEEASDRKATAERANVARFAVGAVVAVVVLLFLLSMLARLWISRPLNQLGRAVRATDGDEARLSRRRPP